MYNEQKKKFDIMRVYDRITCPLCYVLSLSILIAVTVVLVLSDLSIYKCEILLKLKCILIKRGDNFAIINTQILALWAAANSFLIYYLGHIRDDFYGVKIIDSFKVKYTTKKCIGLIIYNIIFLGITFWAVLSKRYLVITYYEILHFLNMLFVITMVLSEISLVTIKKRIVNQTCQKMLVQEKQDLLGTLCISLLQANCSDDKYLQDIKSIFMMIFEEYTNSKEFQLNKQNKEIIFEFSKQFTQSVLKSNREKGMVRVALQWFLVHLELTDPIYLIVKKGIICTLLDNVLTHNCPDLKDMLGIQYDQQEEILCWAIVYNLYLRYKYKQAYRKLISLELFRLLDKQRFDVEKQLFKTWLQFLENEYQQENKDREMDSHFEYFKDYLEEEILC